MKNFFNSNIGIVIIGVLIFLSAQKGANADEVVKRAVVSFGIGVVLYLLFLVACH